MYFVIQLAQVKLGINKNGFKIGDDHSIYLTENVGADANTLVLEANNKVILTKPSLTANVSTPTYTDLKLNDMYGRDIILTGELTGNTVSVNSEIEKFNNKHIVDL